MKAAFSQFNFPAIGECFGACRHPLVLSERSVNTAGDRQERGTALLSRLLYPPAQMPLQSFQEIFVVALFGRAALTSRQLRIQLGNVVRIDAKLPQVFPHLPSVIPFTHDYARRLSWRTLPFGGLIIRLT